MLLCKLGYTTCLIIIAFIGFYIGILVYEHYYVILAPILFYHLCSILSVSCSCRIIPYARHLAFVSPLAWGVLTPLDPHVQVSELGPKGIFPAEDQAYFCGADRPAVAPVTSSLPPCWLAAPPAISWAPFCTAHTCIYLYILAFAPIGDVILL